MSLQVTAVAPGPFDTGDITKMPIAPPHPAYNNPKLPGMMIRQGFPRPGDPKKAMEVVYKLTELENPPVHFPLGPEAVETFKTKAAAYVADADRFADWNKDLHKDA